MGLTIIYLSIFPFVAYGGSVGPGGDYPNDKECYEFLDPDQVAGSGKKKGCGDIPDDINPDDIPFNFCSGGDVPMLIHSNDSVISGNELTTDMTFTLGLPPICCDVIVLPEFKYCNLLIAVDQNVTTCGLGGGCEEYPDMCGSGSCVANTPEYDCDVLYPAPEDKVNVALGGDIQRIQMRVRKETMEEHRFWMCSAPSDILYRYNVRNFDSFADCGFIGVVDQGFTYTGELFCDNTDGTPKETPDNSWEIPLPAWRQWMENGVIDGVSLAAPTQADIDAMIDAEFDSLCNGEICVPDEASPPSTSDDGGAEGGTGLPDDDGTINPVDDDPVNTGDPPIGNNPGEPSEPVVTPTLAPNPSLDVPTDTFDGLDFSQTDADDMKTGDFQTVLETQISTFTIPGFDLQLSSSACAFPINLTAGLLAGKTIEFDFCQFDGLFTILGFIILGLAAFYSIKLVLTGT